MTRARDRLQRLRSELEAGERQLQLLDERRAHLRDTLLRIAGAIQVLEELEAGDEEGSAVAS
jgi:prefoldin subunit 5